MPAGSPMDANKPEGQYDIWSFDNLSRLIGSYHADSGFGEDSLEDACKMGNLDDKQLAELALKLSRRKSQEIERIKKLHQIDTLTGLDNQASFAPKLKKIIDELNYIPANGEKRTIRLHSVMVLFLDLNGFKNINDQYGHNVGDDALLAFANRLKQITKRGDALFRVGGDEFVVVLPIDTPDVDFEKMYRERRETINNDLYADSKDMNGNPIKIKLEAAVGYSALEKGEQKTPEELRGEADLAMYKDKGKSQRV